MYADLCLVDSNFLVYARYAEGPHHVASTSLLEKAGHGDAGFAARTPENAVQAIRAILNQQHPVTGGRIFDLQIAATMQGKRGSHN